MIRSGLKRTKYHGSSSATRKVAETLKFPRKEEAEKGKGTERHRKDGKERKGKKGGQKRKRIELGGT